MVIFADNVGSKRGLRRAIDELQAIPRPDGLEAPLAVMTDQEGGAVERIEGPPSASGAEMGAEGTEFAAAQGRATARLLGRVGVNIDLAPVVDVGRSGAAITEEGRSFGSKPDRVIGSAVNGFAAGLRDGGIAATAKHFPGFGAATVNTDFEDQEIELSRSKLRRIDEAPFAAFAEDGGELIMLSNARYSAFGGEPASLNREDRDPRAPGPARLRGGERHRQPRRPGDPHVRQPRGRGHSALPERAPTSCSTATGRRRVTSAGI